MSFRSRTSAERRLTGVVPEPAHAERREGAFVLTSRTTVGVEGELGHGEASFLRSALSTPTGLDLGLQADEDSADIVLRIDPLVASGGYRLEVSTERIVLAAAEPEGLFGGVQTLLQLLPPAVYRSAPVGVEAWEVPAVTIDDRPKFRWRGLMVDVVCHFLPKRELLRLIDLLAIHKMNVLHLHLTDDQGWRMQINRYPRLTEIGAWRTESMRGVDPERMDGRPHGGYYSQDDLREIVAYAAVRHITVVPEIDVPGHTQAAIAAYPELGVTGTAVETFTKWGIAQDILNMNDSTVDFMKNVFDEVMDIFPSLYIGVGGDECPKDGWREDPATQARMKELGLESEEELQAWFIGQMNDHLRRRGRRLFGWDEILEGGLVEGATVASWRGDVGAVSAATLGHDVVACPSHSVYFDYRQSDLPNEPIPIGIKVSLEDVYNFDPVPAGLPVEAHHHILGAQGHLWSETMDSPRTLDYFAFPRLCALADVLWRSNPPDYAAFSETLSVHLERLDALGVEYRPLSGPHPWQERPDEKGLPQTRADYDKQVADLTSNIALDHRS